MTNDQTDALLTSNVDRINWRQFATRVAFAAVIATGMAVLAGNDPILALAVIASALYEVGLCVLLDVPGPLLSRRDAGDGEARRASQRRWIPWATLAVLIATHAFGGFALWMVFVGGGAAVLLVVAFLWSSLAMPLVWAALVKSWFVLVVERERPFRLPARSRTDGDVDDSPAPTIETTDPLEKAVTSASRSAPEHADDSTAELIES